MGDGVEMLYQKSIKLYRSILATSVILVATLLTLPCAQAQQYKMETPIPPGITTPDKVDTRLGTLKFEGGYPDAATVEKVYEISTSSAGLRPTSIPCRVLRWWRCAGAFAKLALWTAHSEFSIR